MSLLFSYFNQVVGTDGAVGIWHETYSAASGSNENIYVNMPAFGLGRAGRLEKISAREKEAKARLSSL
jgi:hypothetical protein